MDIKLSKISVKVGPEKRMLFKIPRFELKYGQKILIKGASGKGKTTFLNLISGLFTPDEGYVEIGDTEITKLNDEERSVFRRDHFGIIFQKLNLIDHLTALENIELAVRDKNAFERASSSLSAVGLGGRENDRTSVMSLGEQQRVAIARVLASDSSIVFADEPTSSLDEANAFEVMKLLLEACKNKTLIVVSHDQRIEKFFNTTLSFNEIIR